MIFKPFLYLKIKHEQKVWWDSVYPLLTAVAFVILLLTLDLDIQFVGADGLLRQINGLLGVLAGFYIASLTAIAALQSKSLDEQMAGDAPTLNVVEDGKPRVLTLKRREFLRYLFGYLAVSSIIMFFTGIALDIFYAPVVRSIAFVSCNLHVITPFAIFAYIFALTNIMINTLVGVYYLTDRMHRSQPLSEVKPTSLDGDPDPDTGFLED